MEIYFGCFFPRRFFAVDDLERAARIQQPSGDFVEWDWVRISLCLEWLSCCIQKAIEERLRSH
jgi:hypothetical protein